MLVKKNLPTFQNCRTVRTLHQKVFTELNQIDFEYQAIGQRIQKLSDEFLSTLDASERRRISHELDKAERRLDCLKDEKHRPSNRL